MVEKTPENCSSNAKYRDGYMSWCKACTAESSRRSYLRKAPEERRAQARKWREANREKRKTQRNAERRADPERYREQERKRYAANPEAGRKRQREYRARHLEAVRGRYRKWEAENYERRLVINSRRRARLAGAFVEDVDRHVVLKRDDGVCGICGEDVDPFDFQVDHILPLARAGFPNYQNSQVVHPLCNQRKNVRLVEGVA